MPRARLLGIIITATFFLFLSLVPFAYAHPAKDNQGVKFSDIDQTHPNWPYINYLTSEGIISGFPDGTYRPSESFTRAQAAAVMVKAMGLSTDGVIANTFTDVPVSHWAFIAIGAAEKAGLISGFPDGTYRPNDTLTRAQSVALILRLSGQPLPQTPLPRPVDISPEHWAAASVAVALDAGMLDLQDIRFNPNGAFTRSDMARALSTAMTLSPTTRTIPLAGELVPKKGTVKVKKAGEPDFRIVREKIIVGPGDSINTEANSSAELLFPDGSGLLLDPQVRMTIKDSRGLAYIKKNGSPGNAVDWLNIDLQRGKVFVFLAAVIPTKQTESLTRTAGNAPLWIASADKGDWLRIAAQAQKKDVQWWQEPGQKKVKVQVDMPWGVAGIRGSAGSFEVKEDGSSIVNNLFGDFFAAVGDISVVIGPNQTVSVAATGLLTEPREMTLQELREFLSEQVRIFFENRSNEALENQSLQGEQEQVSSSELQQQVLEQVFQHIIQNASGPTSQTSNGSSTSSVTINAINNISITSGKVTTINVVTNPADATVGAVSNNTSVAAVSVSGNIITLVGKDPGTATITVTASRSGYSTGQTSFTVSVSEVRLGEPVLIRGVPLIFEGGIKLDFGMSEIPEGTYVTVTSVGNPIIPMDSNLSVTGAVVDIRLYNVNNHPVQGISAVISLPCNDATDAALMYYNEEAQYWEDQGGVLTGDSLVAAVNHFSIYGVFSAPQAVAPVATPQSGAVRRGTQVTLSSATTDATIFYTTDGTEPPRESTKYTEPITINDFLSLKAVAVKPNMRNSTIAEFEYTLAAHTYGSISGVVHDAGTNAALVDVTVRLLYNAQQIAQTTTTSNGGYVFNEIVTGSGFKIEFYKQGYLLESYENISVKANITNYLETVILQKEEQEIRTGSIQGYIYNALNGNGVTGLSINFRRGINVTTGEIVISVVTGSNGAYTVDNLVPGSYTGEIVGANYITAYFTAVCLEGITNTEQNGTVTPVLPEGETRLVLTWGEKPRDLDSHLTGPTLNGRFHIYYGDRTHVCDNEGDQITCAELDVDCTNSWGPETITIYDSTAKRGGFFLYFPLKKN